MPWFRALFLIAVITVTPGYMFRCYLFCIDQTAVQDNYVEQRDRCREYAQMKLDMAMRDVEGPHDEKARKAQLVTLFSQCMGNNGWTVPDGKEKPTAGATPLQPPTGVGIPPVPTAASVAADKAESKAAVSRASECAFARYSADVSANAAARAAACDTECEERLRAAPEAPLPAACPAESKPKLSKGVEKDNP